mmetsp:Transcript_13410/g.57141  ORF Transcript_13410/g.57141 Transcript_13410/m.57141 type:complete len:329 (+) Transcript_13410:772-1758(+)
MCVRNALATRSSVVVAKTLLVHLLVLLVLLLHRLLLLLALLLLHLLHLLHRLFRLLALLLGHLRLHLLALLLRQDALDGVHDRLRLALNLDVHRAPHVFVRKHGLADRLRDQPHVEPPRGGLPDRQRTPVHGDEPFRQDVLAPLLVQLEHHAPVILGVLLLDDGRLGVDVPRHGVAADLVAHSRAPLVVHGRPRHELAEVRGAQRLHDQVEARGVALGLYHGEARAVARDARADEDPIQSLGGKLELQTREVADVVEGNDLRGALHEAGKERGRDAAPEARARGSAHRAGLDSSAAARALEPAREGGSFRGCGGERHLVCPRITPGSA